MPVSLPSTSQITRAAISFAAVVAAYWLYALLAVPWIEPVAAEREHRTSGAENPMSIQPVTQHSELLKSLYPDPSVWQRRRPKIVETDRAVLLLKDYHTLDDGRMEIKPCTLLFVDPAKTPRADGHPGRVIVLDAPEGAILQFDNKLDIRRAQFGRLVGGRLVGKVTIRSNESTPGADDRLYLATRNVNMDEQRVWTPHDVEFRYGRSYGRGRDLIITLLPAGETTGRQRGPNIGGVKSLELVQLERLHLVAEDSVFSARRRKKDSGHGEARNKPPLADPTRRTESPVEITCKGPFLFDLENSVATFEEQVDVLRLNPDGPSDQLNCRLLEIHFDRMSHAGGHASLAAAAARSRVRKVVALGYPVVLRSPSLAAQARGERLEYDLAQRQFRLDGQQPVMLAHQGRRIEARAVQYQMPQQGRIGRAWAQGPGNFRAEFPNEDPQELPRVVAAQWRDELNLRPDGAGHVLSLSGAARVSDAQFGGLSAGEIHLWLKERSALDEMMDPTRSPSEGVLPDRLLAENNVELESPALTGSTSRFEVWFHHVPQATLARADAPAADERRGPPRRSTAAAQAPAARYDVSGKVLRVLLAAGGKNVQLRDVSVEGQAHIRETKTAQEGEVPIEIAGDFVHVTAADSPQAQAVVAGKPAVVSGRGVTLKGTSIHLDRAANRIWAPGAGEAALPLAGGLGGMDHTRRITAVDGQPRRVRLADLKARPAGSQTATVTWRDGLQFDGQTVQLRGGVRATTQQQRLAAPSVDVTLTQRVDFSQPPRNHPIDVQNIQLHGQVTMEGRTVENGQLAAVDEMMVRDMTIDQQTGALSAAGPGWIKTVRRGRQMGPRQFAGPAFGNTRLASAGRDARSSRDTEGLTYLRVTFQTAMTGNIHRRHVQLHDGVRAVYGSVTDWRETIDPDRALDANADVVVLTSDTLQVAEMGGAPQGPSPGGLGPVEIQAQGNALVEGSTFTARAHRVAYAQAKDLLVMEGDGRTDAELYRQSQVGGETGRAAARKILYHPSTGRMDVDTFNSLDWAGPPVARGEGSQLPGGVSDYLRREQDSRPQRFSTPPR